MVFEGEKHEAVATDQIEVWEKFPAKTSRLLAMSGLQLRQT